MGGQAMELRKFSVLLPMPETKGDSEEMPFLMGQGAGLVKDIPPAGEVVQRMMSEAQGVLGRLAQVCG